MANTRADQSPPFDPKADLELLERSKSSVAVNDVLDFGPWWYAPLLATCVGGLTLFGAAFGAPANIAFGIAGFGAGGIMAVHDYRRRTVRPKFSRHAFGLLAGIFAIAWVTLGLWGTALSSIGYDDFVPFPAVAAWTLTTVMFLAVRQLCQSILQRRTAAV